MSFLARDFVMMLRSSSRPLALAHPQDTRAEKVGDLFAVVACDLRQRHPDLFTRADAILSRREGWRSCERCGSVFVLSPMHPKRRFCREKCRMRASARRNRRKVGGLVP